MNGYVNYEVKSPTLTVAWFVIESDAEAFIQGLDLEDASGYSIHEVKKIVTEDN